MKHEQYKYIADTIDLHDAETMIVDGKALRKKVFTRIRNRAYRARKKAAAHD